MVYNHNCGQYTTKGSFCQQVNIKKLLNITGQIDFFRLSVLIRAVFPLFAVEYAEDYEPARHDRRATPGEQTVVTIDRRLADFYFAFYDEIISFDKEWRNAAENIADGIDD